MQGRVLIVAGSDSGGGAGIQADIKAVTALGGFAMTAITALTAQNTLGVHGVFEVDPAFIQQQMRVCLDDLGADCIKTGMLHSVPVIEAVAEVLADYPRIPLVVDPVMRAKGGAALLLDEAQEALTRLMVSRARVVTPNVPEAEALLAGQGLSIASPDDLETAGHALVQLGAGAALMKGGHLEGAGEMVDVLVDAQAEGGTEVTRLSHGPRLETRHTHGTGCTVAASLACGLAQGLPLPEAAKRATAYVRRAIETAPGFGAGHGPLNHAWPLEA